MKRERCKNYADCRGWQLVPKYGLCRSCYIKLKGYSTAAYKRKEDYETKLLPREKATQKK
jgi:hypothetical protein